MAKSTAYYKKRKRYDAFIRQGGLCYYCSSPMYERTIEKPKQAKYRLGKQWKDVKYHLCTLEHLVRVTDGGTTAIVNVVAACAHCNSLRGTIPPDVWKGMRNAQS